MITLISVWIYTKFNEHSKMISSFTIIMMQELKNVETSELNPSGVCTSKNKHNWRQIDFDQTV